MIGLGHALHAYAIARWRERSLRSRAAVGRFQTRHAAALGRHLRDKIPFYAGIDPDRFDRWPIVDKERLLANFAAMNLAGLSLTQVREALAQGRATIDGYGIGHSTGTSGHRGYFVISEAERFVWLGTLLAKALPDALWRRHRVALALPGFSRLYRAADDGSRIALGLFDLAEGIDAWQDRLAAFAPDTIVAPPKVLRLLAERGRLVARTIFSAAEVLDPLDEAVIREATGRRVRQIYMATEGLFGVSCAYGTLHLAEDVVRFEWEAGPEGSGLVQPLVTDLTRRVQAMVRYRMNDLLLLDDRPCPCGSPFQAVKRIEGRSDDVFWLADRGGTLRPVTPDVIRTALLDADDAIDDFRVIQLGPSRLAITLPHDRGDAAAAMAGLTRLRDRLGLAALDLAVDRGITPPFDRKLRRVRRDWTPPQSQIVRS